MDIKRLVVSEMIKVPAATIRKKSPEISAKGIAMSSRPRHWRGLIPGEVRVDKPRKDQLSLASKLCPYVRQSGNEWRTIWYCAPCKLLDYLLLYIDKGQASFTVGLSSFDAGDGDLIWIPPDTLHEVRGTSAGIHLLYVHFDLLYDLARSHWDAHIPGGTRDLSKFEKRMHPNLGDPVISSLCGKVCVSNQALILSLLEQICLEHSRSPLGSMVLLSGLMLQLLHYAFRGAAPTAALKHPHWNAIQDAAAFISESSDKDLNLSAIASAAGLSPSHFRKLFRQIHGNCARTVHRQARIGKACALLAKTEKGIKEIGASVGFSTIHSFSRAFHEVMGISPIQYRRGGT